MLDLSNIELTPEEMGIIADNILRTRPHDEIRAAMDRARIYRFDTDLARFTPRQLEAVKHLTSGQIKYLLYGGALGGGKSYLLRWYCLRFLLDVYRDHGLKHVTVMLACEDYPSLKDRQLSKIAREFPEWLGQMRDDHKEYGKSFVLNSEYGSGVICFRNLDDPSKYQSSEWALIAVDELTKNDYDTFTFLRSRLRWPGLPDIACQFIGGTNPGGVGHGWVKQLWIDRTFPDEFIDPDVDYRSQFAFVPSKADDNPHLAPSYWHTLNTLPENLRKAFRDGSWDVFVGQAFPEFSCAIHVIPPVSVLAGASTYMTYDWGFGAPFSIGWWWVDADGRIYRFSEWYGWTGTANQGLRMADSDVAQGIIDREERLRFDNSNILRLAGPDCFQKKPDYKGGGQGKSTSDEFAEKGIFLNYGDPSRVLKVRQFHERLKPQADAPPMMLIYSTCEHFIRTIPQIVVDPNNIEDVDTKGEDHVFDEACHICMARPMNTKPKTALLDTASMVQAYVMGKSKVLPWQVKAKKPGTEGRYVDFGDTGDR